MAELKKGARITGGDRTRLAADLKRKYSGGVEHPRAGGRDRPLLRVRAPHPRRVRGHPARTRRCHARQEVLTGSSPGGARPQDTDGVRLEARGRCRHGHARPAGERATPRRPRPGGPWPRSAASCWPTTRRAGRRAAGGGPVLLRGARPGDVHHRCRRRARPGLPGRARRRGSRRGRSPASREAFTWWRDERVVTGGRGAGARRGCGLPAGPGLRPAGAGRRRPGWRCGSPRSASCRTWAGPRAGPTPSATPRALEICATGRWVTAAGGRRHRAGLRHGRRAPSSTPRPGTSRRPCSPRRPGRCAPRRHCCAMLAGRERTSSSRRPSGSRRPAGCVTWRETSKTVDLRPLL